jgi:hypothetical protein
MREAKAHAGHRPRSVGRHVADPIEAEIGRGRRDGNTVADIRRSGMQQMRWQPTSAAWSLARIASTTEADAKREARCSRFADWLVADIERDPLGRPFKRVRDRAHVDGNCDRLLACWPSRVSSARRGASNRRRHHVSVSAKSSPATNFDLQCSLRWFLSGFLAPYASTRMPASSPLSSRTSTPAQ